MRWSWLLGGVLAFGLSACAQSAGEATESFIDPGVASAYIPLQGAAYLVMEGHGAGLVVAPHVAVTNAHNANLVEKKTILGSSPHYDLLFFYTDKTAVPQFAEPHVNERVIAYGQGTGDELRMAQGVVKWLDAEVVARCPTCPVQHAFIFEANAGPGFSGGPVVDAETGKVLGIVFGFRDDQKGGIEKLMYAYDMSRVNAELANIHARPEAPAQREFRP